MLMKNESFHTSLICVFLFCNHYNANRKPGPTLSCRKLISETSIISEFSLKCMLFVLIQTIKEKMNVFFFTTLLLIVFRRYSNQKIRRSHKWKIRCFSTLADWILTFMKGKLIQLQWAFNKWTENYSQRWCT